jgi:ketosteroid isomerase-like protein
MAVKVKLLRIGVVAFILATFLASRAAAQEDLVGLVQALEDAMSRGDLDGAMAMYADDAEFEFVGMGSLVGQEQIRGYKEYIAALNTDLQYSDCTAEGNTVTCKLTKNDDMLRKVAAGPVSHSMAFTFADGLIKKQAVTTPPASAQILGQTSGAFLGWVKENQPGAMAKLFTAEGQFVYSGDNGALVASLIPEWVPAALPVTGGSAPTATLLLWLGVSGLLLIALGLGLKGAFKRAQ